MALVVFDIDDLERIMEKFFGKYIPPYPIQQIANDELLQIQEAAKMLEASIFQPYTPIKKMVLFPFIELVGASTSKNPRFLIH